MAAHGESIEIDEVQTIGAEVLIEFHRLQGLPSTGSAEEDFRRLSRFLGIAALKALPQPTEHHQRLLRQALAEA